MNPGDVTTTEINTEIKLEVKVETASIVKVETLKYPDNKTLQSITNTQMPTAEMSSQETSKTREEIKAEREAKKLAKQAKKGKSSGAGVNENVTMSTTETPTVTTKTVDSNDTKKPTNCADGGEGEKSRDQIKAEREAKKLAKQAAKTAKTGGGPAVGAVTEQMAQVNLKENSTSNVTATSNETAAPGEKVN